MGKKGAWKWCIGCKVPLTEESTLNQGAEAYSKTNPLVMERDLAHHEKKCAVDSDGSESLRTFYWNSTFDSPDTVSPALCDAKCVTDPLCRYYSMLFQNGAWKWCIGCKVPPTAHNQGAEVYKK